jgi:mannose-6-phosphate isomerase-like protein (cupin superfamily)
MTAHDPLAIAAGLRPFEFHPFARFNSGDFAVFRGSSVGASQWEMHPDTDELLFVMSGRVTVELLINEWSTLIPLSRGQLVIVPRGVWHRHRDAHDLVELYYTPGRSVASNAEDPRTTPPADLIDVTPVDEIAALPARARAAGRPRPRVSRYPDAS